MKIELVFKLAYFACNFMVVLAFYKMMKNLKTIFLCVMMILSLNVFSQKVKETIDNSKRKFTKTEVRFMSAKFDSIKFNLNRMIIFEKELRQRNFYLNEKTALVNDLVSMVEQLQQSLDVVDVQTSNIKSIFGKASYKSPKTLVYEIETFESNCPFIQITFYVQETKVTKLEYKITDCQKWK